jgi:biopolymer transport protein ExbD
MEPKLPFMPMPEPAPPQQKVMHHRKWVVHSHDASRPAHVDAKSDINITPLIDVMLVLLIIFMVVTPLAQKGLDIALPQPPPPNAPQTPQIGQVVLSVEDSPSGPLISVNKTPVANMEDLDQKLKDIFQTKSDKTIFVRASGKVPYGKVVEAMDVARGAGVERVGIISEKMVEDAGGG